MALELTDALAERFSRIALSHVSREYPNKLDHVMTGAADALSPRALHPIFFGSFDWHSCVHGYWLLARCLRRRPAHGEAAAVRALFAERLTPAGAAGELAYLERPASRGFERPYGWAWLLMLARELDGLEDGGFGQTLAPLARAFEARFKDFLPKADYPVRTGVHSSSAFALRLALAYGDDRSPSFAAQIRERARAWFSADRDARPFEPSGEDFLSPALMEAALMSAVAPGGTFLAWFDAFLPDFAAGRPACLFEPARVSDRSDGKIAHLDGLNLSRAWCLRSLAAALSSEGRVLSAERAQGAADLHLAAAIDQIEGDYMGEHWLASFALLAIDGL